MSNNTIYNETVVSSTISRALGGYNQKAISEIIYTHNQLFFNFHPGKKLD